VRRRWRLVTFAAIAACTNDVLQGNAYNPPNALPLGTPSDRSGETDGAIVDALLDHQILLAADRLREHIGASLEVVEERAAEAMRRRALRSRIAREV